jgi:hemolysin-activating ACP:hemolysin acyltransferase
MDINKIIKLYKSFPKYQQNSYSDLFYHILPSLQANQFKVYGFVSWAYLNKDVEESYKKKGSIYKNEWNCGVNLWIYDIVCIRKTKEVASWIVKYCLNKIKNDECFSWIRLNKNNEIYRISKKYKRDYHKSWVV